MEEYLKIAQANEKMCGDEIKQCLEKYRCTMHVVEVYTDSQLAQRTFNFKFNPQAYEKREVPN